MKFFGTKDIKIFIKSLLIAKRNELENKVVLDIPAGSGYSSAILKSINAKVEAYDLFPDFFKVDGMICRVADLSKELPVKSYYADFILCQEGIEHLADQFSLFREFNRILKKNGHLLITTPNESKLRSKLSYFLSESEHFYKVMPPNEIDSIWFSNREENGSIYFGHIFMIGIQKLRVLAKLSGFKIKKIHHFRINYTSLFLLLFTYPFILIVSIFGYFRAMSKNNLLDSSIKKQVYSELLRLGINPGILIGGHLIVEFEKEYEYSELHKSLISKYKNCDIVT
jgi:2-polyprenyl-3-methyl-5-hydroxy-6-metoxy-1,4-benzoquinol methylase